MVYYHGKLQLYINNTKNAWKIYREIIGKANDKSTLPDIFQMDGIKGTDIIADADGFDSFFVNVGKSTSNSINHGHSDFRNYLKSSSNHNLYLMPTDKNEIIKIIEDLKPKKSFGRDKLSSLFIKSIAPEICEGLAIAVNKSIESGEVPLCLKTAKIIPV